MKTHRVLVLRSTHMVYQDASFKLKLKTAFEAVAHSLSFVVRFVVGGGEGHLSSLLRFALFQVVLACEVVPFVVLGDVACFVSLFGLLCFGAVLLFAAAV